MLSKIGFEKDKFVIPDLIRDLTPLDQEVDAETSSARH